MFLKKNIYIYYDIDLSNMDEVLQTIYIFYIYTHILFKFFRKISIFYLSLF